MQLYIFRPGNQQTYGPYAENVLMQYLQAGNISLTDHASVDGTTWQPLHTFLSLTRESSAVPSSAPTTENQTPSHSPAYPPQVPSYPYPAPAPGYTHYPAPSYVQPKQRIAYILLGLFLGGLGIHNFYAGYVARGVVQLVISVVGLLILIGPLISGIWALIEICTVRTDSEGIPFV